MYNGIEILMILHEDNQFLNYVEKFESNESLLNFIRSVHNIVLFFVIY